MFLSSEETEEYILSKKASTTEIKQKLEAEKEDNTKVLAGLKSELYSKFGKEINLDDGAE